MRQARRFAGGAALAVLLPACSQFHTRLDAPDPVWERAGVHGLTATRDGVRADAWVEDHAVDASLRLDVWNLREDDVTVSVVLDGALPGETIGCVASADGRPALLCGEPLVLPHSPPGWRWWDRPTDGYGLALLVRLGDGGAPASEVAGTLRIATADGGAELPLRFALTAPSQAAGVADGFLRAALFLGSVIP